MSDKATNQTSLAIMSKVEKMLAEATTIQKAKEVRNLALSAVDFAKRNKLGFVTINKIMMYANQAFIVMGERLAETERAKGVRVKGGSKRVTGGNIVLPPEDSEPTLVELGISKRQSSMATALAKEAPKALREAFLNNEITVSKAYRKIKKKKDAENREARTTFNGMYRVLYADPPWCYSDKCETGAIQSGGAERHYSSMTIQQLCDLRDDRKRHVRDIAEKNAVLFLWVTSPILPECFAVITAWGFVYKASFVWDKVRHNMGHYNSVRHELLLIAVRGSCLPDSDKLVDSVISIERTKNHSEKPETFRTIIDAMYVPPKRGTHDRIELFGRTVAEGWDVFGDGISPST